MNVFEDQQFLLRRHPTPDHPLGERVKRSWRDIMTGPDEGLRFDYPVEYHNTAALGLCIALTQATFEPSELEDLANRILEPISDDEIERVIAPLRDSFSIDRDRRFMQGPEPAQDKKGRFDTGHLSELMLTMKKGDKVFLNRPEAESVVALDQIPLLIFSRATYFEKSAGRGYLTGTSGDLEIRTYLIDKTSLRRSIWLNVLTQEKQEGRFTAAGEEDGYDAWMWETPPSDDVAQGDLSLRSGLFWMVANAYVVIEEVESPRPCIVTGEMIDGRVGTGVVVSATGKGYGVKVQREKGPDVRQSFFLHPNGPRQFVEPKKGDPFTCHLSVKDYSGMIGEMGGLFFASTSGAKGYSVAPVVDQLYGLKRRVDNENLNNVLDHLDMLCFGFHMLSSKQNVHGGYEVELYHYPILGTRDEDDTAVRDLAEELMTTAAGRVGQIEYHLARSVQLCTMLQIDTEESDGVLEFSEKKKIESGGLMRDASTELWRTAGDELFEFLERIGSRGATHNELSIAADELKAWWTDQVVAHAETIFMRIFDDYSTSPQHLVAAHRAKRRFYAGLRKVDDQIFQRRNEARKSVASTEETIS